MELNMGKTKNKKQTNLHVQYIIAWLQSVSKLLGQITILRQMFQTLQSPGAPFQCCVLFAIKFDESKCFDL